MTFIRTYRIDLLPLTPMFKYQYGTYVYKVKLLKVPRITT